MSEFIQHIPCPHCGSQDNGGEYSSGWAHCFGCGKNWRVTEGEHGVAMTFKDCTVDTPFARVNFREIPERRLQAATCIKWSYGFNDFGDQVAQYFHNGQLVAQKTRAKDKKFRWVGTNKGLYGQWLWKDGGTRVTVTEGEIDALSVSQANGLKYPVVSVPNGAQGAKRAVQDNLEWLESFQEVTFMFDMDEPGRKAALECAELLTPGKARIAHLEAKDPNELLVQGFPDKIQSAMWQAQPFRPDGVLSWDQVVQRVRDYNVDPIAKWPFDELNTKAKGLRAGEISLLCAGVGVGKSKFCKQVAESLASQGLRVGIVSLEEPVEKYALELAGLRMGENLAELEGHPQDRPEFWEALDGLKGQVEFYDDQGVREYKTLFSKIRYMAVALGCQVIILDHLTVVIGGTGGANQVADTDHLMMELESLVKRTGISALLVMHLRKVGSGQKPHEEGGRVTLADVRGSGLIYALSHNVLALERDQQGDRPDIATMRSLKWRHTGYTGELGLVRWDQKSGKLYDYDEVLGELESQVQEDPF